MKYRVVVCKVDELEQKLNDMAQEHYILDKICSEDEQGNLIAIFSLTDAVSILAKEIYGK